MPPVYLNDAALDPHHRGVFVSDMNNRGHLFTDGVIKPVDDPSVIDQPARGRVYHIAWDGTVTLAVSDDPDMLHPNGIYVEPDGRILAASFFLSHVVAEYPGEDLVGHRTADGVETDEAGNLFVTEVKTGNIWQRPPNGREPVLLHRAKSAADHFLDRDRNLLIVPDSTAGQLVFIAL